MKRTALFAGTALLLAAAVASAQPGSRFRAAGHMAHYRFATVSAPATAPSHRLSSSTSHLFAPLAGPGALLPEPALFLQAPFLGLESDHSAERALESQDDEESGRLAGAGPARGVSAAGGQ